MTLGVVSWAMTGGGVGVEFMSDTITILNYYTEQVAWEIAARQDALIRDCITERIGPDWKEPDIFQRLNWEIDRNKPEKMLLLDDKPLLLIWPPESSMVMDPEAANTKWTIRYKRLP